jgi:hypothetical protein
VTGHRRPEILTALFFSGALTQAELAEELRKPKPDEVKPKTPLSIRSDAELCALLPYAHQMRSAHAGNPALAAWVIRAALRLDTLPAAREALEAVLPCELTGLQAHEIMPLLPELLDLHDHPAVPIDLRRQMVRVRLGLPTALPELMALFGGLSINDMVRKHLGLMTSVDARALLLKLLPEREQSRLQGVPLVRMLEIAPHVADFLGEDEHWTHAVDRGVFTSRVLDILEETSRAAKAGYSLENLLRRHLASIS